MARLEKIIIRKAIIDDLLTMLQIQDETLGTSSTGSEMQEQLELLLTRFNNHPQFVFYVAEIDQGNLIGWCRGGKTVETHKIVAGQMYDCEIHSIFIRPQYQHRGIGRKLWEVVWNDVLLSFHPKNFVVWSVDKEHAHKFYSSLGGTEQEKRKLCDEYLHTAFVWNDLNLYKSTNFILFK